MKPFRYVTDNEIAFNNSEDAFKVAETLLKNNYVVMVSKEEQVFIVNFLWTENYADRNEVCFQHRDEVEEFAFMREGE